MKAWILEQTHDLTQVSAPLVLVDRPVPDPGKGQVLIRVSVCGVCHTELDEIEGRTPPPHYPVILGHQVVGYIEKLGAQTKRFRVGDRVGVAWIFSACGECAYCKNGLENLCEQFQGTGRDAHGGYAQYMVVQEDFTYAIPKIFSDAEAAPLLCAGAIGYRSLKLSGLVNGQTLGLTGFGASGHLVLKMVKSLYPESPILVFARDVEEQAFARSIGASWAGSAKEQPPFKAHAIIDTTPVWTTIVESLLHLLPGGRMIINAIRKESADQQALLKLRYQDHLWMEKEIKSVANITRKDVEEFLTVAAKIPIKSEVEIYAFHDANKALADLKLKHVRGAKVLSVSND